MYLHYLLPCPLDNHKSAGPPFLGVPLLSPSGFLHFHPFSIVFYHHLSPLDIPASECTNSGISGIIQAIIVFCIMPKKKQNYLDGRERRWVYPHKVRNPFQHLSSAKFETGLSPRGSFDGKPLVSPLATSLCLSHIFPPQTQDDLIKLL